MTARQAKINAIQFAMKSLQQERAVCADNKQKNAYQVLHNELELKAKNLERTEEHAKAKKDGLIPKSGFGQPLSLAK